MAKIFKLKRFNYFVWTPSGSRVNIYINFCLQVQFQMSAAWYCTHYFDTGGKFATGINNASENGGKICHQCCWYWWQICHRCCCYRWHICHRCRWYRWWNHTDIHYVTFFLQCTLQVNRLRSFLVKGTVPQDFLLLVFFMNQFPPSPWLFQ